MVILKRIEQMEYKIENENFDFDRYVIEVKNQISTKEFSIIVDFLKLEITGDTVAYGSWYDIETDECIELLEIILKDNKPKRQFTHILEKNKIN